MENGESSTSTITLVVRLRLLASSTPLQNTKVTLVTVLVIGVE
jgi:hypothetical protein